MSIADYAGRTVDVAIFSSQPDTDVFAQELFGLGSSGEILTGVLKLTQRWALRFLTILGSMPFLPNEGSTFMQAARSGRLRSEATVTAEFRFAAEQLRQQFAADVTPTTPADETLASATLDQILLSLDGDLAIQVSILSLAGTSRSVILPVAVSTLSLPDYP